LTVAPPVPAASAVDLIDKAAGASADELAREASTLRDRINRFRVGLGRFFVAKQPLIDLMCVAAVAQEPLLLVGPPGTAKSDLVIKFKDALRIPDGEYFEYLLTRFTEPSEVFGPIDIAELRAGRYLRRDRGKLPTARLVFLDEIFKANSAILNSLLTVINERKFYQDGQPVPVKLRILLAATNELPENAELAAVVADRAAREHVGQPAVRLDEVLERRVALDPRLLVELAVGEAVETGVDQLDEVLVLDGAARRLETESILERGELDVLG